MSLEERLDSNNLSDDSVQQMLLIAERLRESHGGELDDAAIQAVADLTGAPMDYVRIAVARRAGEAEKQTVTKKWRSAYLSLDPEERQWVMSAGIGAGAGLMYALNERFPLSNGLFGIMLILVFLTGMYNVSTAKGSRMAIISGAVFGATSVICGSVFGLAMGLASRGNPYLILPVTLFTALAGFAVNKLVGSNRNALGLRDPQQERQELLRQLVELQDKLTTGEQACTFLSVDVVGSTQLKGQSRDPLSVEYTFSEYHKFVEFITQKYGGRVHSTAGDGVTCAFDAPQQAFQAAKNMQLGIIELNTLRNKLGSPLILRCGIHSGSVVAPDARDITSVNFSQVIDIAAHLQKVCPAGGIVVSQQAAIEVQGGPSAIGSERVEAHDVEGYVWLPRARISAAAASAPPPFAPEE